MKVRGSAPHRRLKPRQRLREASQTARGCSARVTDHGLFAEVLSSPGVARSAVEDSGCHRRACCCGEAGSQKSGLGRFYPRHSSAKRTRIRPLRHIRVRDARPEGRDGGGAPALYRRPSGCVARRRWPGAVGHSGIVPYRARSPLWRLGAKHARIQQFRSKTKLCYGRICPPSFLVDCPRDVTRGAGRERGRRAKLFANNQIASRTWPVRPMRSPSSRP
jgi:hypothetical protein